MKIFISWSGPVSHNVARALKAWLPNVIQAITDDQIFLSSEDIDKGAQWFNELGQVLEDSDFGILCLTPKNVNAQWILYEAGAVAKHLSDARVTPLLIGLSHDDLKNPLAQFNCTQAEKDDIRRLVESLNRLLGDSRLSDTKLTNAFNAWWPQLEPKLTAAIAATHKQDFDHDVFLSTPMASFASDAEYQTYRANVMKVFRAMKEDCGFRVYWAAENITTMSDFDTLDVSVNDDLSALAGSRCFVLIYPAKLASSALFEAGYALANGLNSHYFVENRDNLPFLMRELAGPMPNVRIHTRSDWKDYADLAGKIIKNKAKWF